MGKREVECQTRLVVDDDASDHPGWEVCSLGVTQVEWFGYSTFWYIEGFVVASQFASFVVEF